jgi:hypothetical protein
VDVTAGPAQVTATLRIADDLAGFGLPPQISPSIGFSVPGMPGVGCSTLTLVTGTEVDQTWECGMTIPQFAPAGTWKAVVNISDLVNNNHYYTSDELQAAGFPTDLAVASNPDTEAPQVVEFGFTPGAVDVTSGPAQITATLRITDNLAGFGLPPQIGPSIGFSIPGTQGVGCSTLTLVDGTALDQTWECGLTIPQFALPGLWKAVVNISDVVNNNHFYTSDELQAAGFPVNLQVGEPEVFVTDVMRVEGNAGLRLVIFPVSLTFASTETVTVNVMTSLGTAQAGVDYAPRAAMVNFPPGTTTRYFWVILRGDGVVEPNETFFVDLSAPTNALIGNGRARGLILNDDAGTAP